jgi:DNA-directed RNA polymerase subunit beta'
MENYTYQNALISKKQLKQLLAWSFTNYDSMQACSLADELKYLGFKYASQAGISISIEDLKVPFVKNLMLQKANQEILNAEKIYLKGKITDVERFQKIIDTWNITSEALKNEVVSFFKNYDPLNSVYIMAFSGARGNLSQVRQLVGMRGLMSDPSGEIMKLPIKKNFREGLTITDYLMSGYGARKGIVDTALKTANSGYLTRRLIDVAQDILIREKDCLTTHSFLISKIEEKTRHQILGRLLNKPIYDPKTNEFIAEVNTQITPNLLYTFKNKQIKTIYIRSPLTCSLYRSICQKCYGWDLATENLVDIGEAVGIIAGQSIGEPGTQLTMRTFHTGGIFTSEASQQIVSPVAGIVRFSKILKTIILRTNRGEDVLFTKNSGSLIIIPENKDQELIQIELLRNTILFSKNNQYIKKNDVIGELANNDKQIRTEITPVLTNTSGEVFMPRLKNRGSLVNSNKLLWLLSGQVYQAPINSFLNFYPDHKLNKNSYTYRTKLINQYSGFVTFVNKKTSLFQRIIKIRNNSYFLSNANIQKLLSPIKSKNYIFNFKNLNYLVNFKSQNSKTFVRIRKTNHFATLVTNNFSTLTGGTIYYSYQVKFDNERINNKNKISYYIPILNDLNKDANLSTSQYNRPTLKKKKKEKKEISHHTLIWLSEETYKLNCDRSILLVEHGSFISENFEIVPGTYSKTAGIILLKQKNNIVQKATIKSGFVYKGKNLNNFAGKVFYPGEIILNDIKITQISVCEHLVEKSNNQLLIRPLEIYEVPSAKSIEKIFGNNSQIRSVFELENQLNYLYKSNQTIKTQKSLNLVSNVLNLKQNKTLKTDITIELVNNQRKNRLDFGITEILYLNNYIPAHLKYTNMDSCLLIQENQFVDNYTILGYLESVTANSLEIVKFKSKSKANKQVFLISNKDCVTIKKKNIKNKTVNDLIINNVNLNKTGKILIENENFVTIQKGRPYFFPNCKNEDSINNTDVQYKIMSLDDLPFSKNFHTYRSVYLNYYDVTKKISKKAFRKNELDQSDTALKSEISKMFLKKNGKIYSSPIVQLFKQFSIVNIKPEQTTNKILTLLDKDYRKKQFRKKTKSKKSQKKEHKTLLMQNSELIPNQFKNNDSSNYKLTFVRFREYPFAKSIGIHSITEDFFEQEVNYVYCKNGEFVENGETIGLLNFEKEITGDIVQGLPRVEELLEARKNKLKRKRVPTNQKKSLLVQKSSVDSNFEFRKLGTTIKENEKINPHKLLKVYFNYYGLIKLYFSDKTYKAESYRLLDIYEASYRSFKKVQSLILNSIQSVYMSQGVSINDKHLEVIIKQMTTKVLVTYEGNTPLLPREVIDLYHIQYINEIVKSHKKRQAYYVPLLLGITKAALNNPSFISAASFQETTRVLTKAAIEGRVDWLRGLKENIIIGHLIPAGTGSQNYANCFKKQFSKITSRNQKVSDLKIFSSKS